jgi:hypothetical protein
MMGERVYLSYKMSLIGISEIKIAVFFFDLRYCQIILYDFTHNIGQHLPSQPLALLRHQLFIKFCNQIIIFLFKMNLNVLR